MIRAEALNSDQQRLAGQNTRWSDAFSTCWSHCGDETLLWEHLFALVPWQQVKHHFQQLGLSLFHRHNGGNHMFKHQQLDSGLECPLCTSAASFVCMSKCVCTLKCPTTEMWWWVYASINPKWLSHSDYSLASLLGLAPEVAQADTGQVAKPLPQTKYQD